jgi:hypothetical protein
MKFAPRMVRAGQFHRCLRACSAQPAQLCKSSLHFTARRASGPAITLDLSGRHTRRPHFLVLPAGLFLMFGIHPAHVSDTLAIGDYVFFDFHLDSFCDRPLFVFGHDFHRRSSKSIPPTVFFHDLSRREYHLGCCVEVRLSHSGVLPSHLALHLLER